MAGEQAGSGLVAWINPTGAKKGFTGTSTDYSFLGRAQRGFDFSELIVTLDADRSRVSIGPASEVRPKSSDRRKHPLNKLFT